MISLLYDNYFHFPKNIFYLQTCYNLILSLRVKEELAQNIVLATRIFKSFVRWYLSSMTWVFVCLFLLYQRNLFVLYLLGKYFKSKQEKKCILLWTEFSPFPIHVEVLTDNVTVFGARAFKEVIQVKWGHRAGP